MLKLNLALNSQGKKNKKKLSSCLYPAKMHLVLPHTYSTDLTSKVPVFCTIIFLLLKGAFNNFECR